MTLTSSAIPPITVPFCSLWRHQDAEISERASVNMPTMS